MSGYSVQLQNLQTAAKYVDNESTMLARLYAHYRDSADTQNQATKGGFPAAWGMPAIPGTYDEFAKQYDDFRVAFMKTLSAAGDNLLQTARALAKIEEHYRRTEADAAAHFTSIHQEITR